MERFYPRTLPIFLVAATIALGSAAGLTTATSADDTFESSLVQITAGGHGHSSSLHIGKDVALLSVTTVSVCFMFLLVLSGLLSARTGVWRRVSAYSRGPPYAARMA